MSKESVNYKMFGIEEGMPRIAQRKSKALKRKERRNKKTQRKTW